MTTARMTSRPPHRTQTRRSVSKVRFNKVRQSMRAVAAYSSPSRMRSQCANDRTFGATGSALPVVVSDEVTTASTASRRKTARPSPACDGGCPARLGGRARSDKELPRAPPARFGRRRTLGHDARAPPMARREDTMKSEERVARRGHDGGKPRQGFQRRPHALGDTAAARLLHAVGDVANGLQSLPFDGRRNSGRGHAPCTRRQPPCRRRTSCTGRGRSRRREIPSRQEFLKLVDDVLRSNKVIESRSSRATGACASAFRAAITRSLACA
ncbi:hypothetical protein BH11MYX4_BH11MYX4_40340 [soil metagenome]